MTFWNDIPPELKARIADHWLAGLLDDINDDLHPYFTTDYVMHYMRSQTSKFLLISPELTPYILTLCRHKGAEFEALRQNGPKMPKIDTLRIAWMRVPSNIRAREKAELAGRQADVMSRLEWYVWLKGRKKDQRRVSERLALRK